MADFRGADYYAERLSGERLRQCYAVAPPRVSQYLSAEIDFVLSQLRTTDVVVELGCGYGRVASELARKAASVVGIDTSRESIELARSLSQSEDRCHFVEMDATSLAFEDGHFDAVVCVQNGIRAFGVDPAVLVSEALRVTGAGGRVLFSSYTAGFWRHRLEWFEAQAGAGLVGELDLEATGGGTIVCRDGLRLEAMTAEQFMDLGSEIGIEPEIAEVDESSLFAIWRVPVLPD